MSEKLVPDPFLKNQNWAYLWINRVKFYTVLYFISCQDLVSGSGSSLPASLSASFLRRMISLVIFYYLTKFNYLVVFPSWDIGQYVFGNCLLTRLWSHNVETKLIFQIKPFFLHDQKFKTKNWISWERKELLKWNKKHFSSFLKGFHWRWESDFKNNNRMCSRKRGKLKTGNKEFLTLH